MNRELSFDGNLYVLTSKYTYGAASFLTTLLKDNKLAQVVGEIRLVPQAYGRASQYRH